MSRPDLTEADTRAELTAMVPPPGDPQLTTERHADLKGAFLARIQAAPEPVRHRRRWVLVAAPITASVLAAGVVAGVVLRPATGPAVHGPAVHGQSTQGPSAQGQSTHGQTAQGSGAVFLNRMAVVTSTRPQTAIGAGQYVYIKSRVAWTGGAADGSGPQKLEPVHVREIWIPQTGSTGMIMESGRQEVLQGMSSNAHDTDLPSDPAVLLRKIYKDNAGQGNSADGEAFTVIGDLLRESLMAPEITAALYRAAAEIPGVVQVPDAVDAAGRHGGAVARVERGERTEWIFDKATGAFLGERSSLATATDGRPAGTLTGTTAVMQRAAVDRVGERP